MNGPIIYPPHPITFEEYMAEEPVKRRYDIINGVRVFAVPPTLHHQDILGNIMIPMSRWGDASGCLTLFSLFDVLISWDAVLHAPAGRAAGQPGTVAAA